MKWYLMAFRKYADFSGRSRRTEYWMFQLFNVLFVILAMIIAMFLVGSSSILPFQIIYFGYLLAIIIPSLAVTVRRLHDTGRGGAWFFISFIPFIGSIWLLVLMCLDSTPGENQYGPNPKNEGNFSSDALDAHLTN